jgi:hypothetical protein
MQWVTDEGLLVLDFQVVEALTVMDAWPTSPSPSSTLVLKTAN